MRLRMLAIVNAISGKAASVLLVRDDPYRVLMVKRRDSGQYASAFVFPGGAVDDSDRDAIWQDFVVGRDDHNLDERAYKIAAARETWEEVSLLIGLADAQKYVSELSSSESYLSVLQNLGLRVSLEDLHYFGHWLTPVDMPKRWDTRFLLARAPLDQEPSIDADEIVSHEWVSPMDAVEMHHQGERQYLYPTLMNLKRLAESSSVAESIERSQSYPRVTAAVVAQRSDEGVWRSVPAEAGYGSERHWTPAEKS